LNHLTVPLAIRVPTEIEVLRRVSSYAPPRPTTCRAVKAL
jgi:hypothetical protein